jgi:hypothetical protein
MDFKYGIQSGHQYHVSKVGTLGTQRYVKVQNPQNMADPIKA